MGDARASACHHSEQYLPRPRRAWRELHRRGGPCPLSLRARETRRRGSPRRRPPASPEAPAAPRGRCPRSSPLRARGSYCSGRRCPDSCQHPQRRPRSSLITVPPSRIAMTPSVPTFCMAAETCCRSRCRRSLRVPTCAGSTGVVIFLLCSWQLVNYRFNGLVDARLQSSDSSGGHGLGTRSSARAPRGCGAIAGSGGGMGGAAPAPDMPKRGCSISANVGPGMSRSHGPMPREQLFVTPFASSAT
jgi:hypothetical protein